VTGNFKPHFHLSGGLHDRAAAVGIGSPFHLFHFHTAHFTVFA
jgi:hypothetical protein